MPETPKTEMMMESSAMLSAEVKTPDFETPEKTRHLSNDSVVGPFQLVNDVGDHPACAVDPSKEFLTRLQPGQEIVMSPTDDDVRVSYKPGNEAQLPLEALYSCCDLSSVTMGKREKEAFRNGLELVNEQDRVLTALVSNAPLDSTHMVVVTDSLLPWEKMDGVVTLGIQDWNKTRKELSQIVSKKPPGLLVGLFSNGVQSAIMHDLMDEVDLHGSGLVVICPNETSQEFQSMSIETRGDMTVYLGGNQMTGLQEEITAWDRLGIAPRCFEDAKHWDLMETLCKKSEERYLGSYTRTCFVADAIIEEESEEMTPDEQEELTVMEKEQLMLDQLALPGAPLQEAERRALWRRLPQRTRVAIRRLRRQFGHPNPTTLKNIPKAGRAPAELQEAARLVRCQACEDTKQKPRDHPVGLKTEFEFNACVGIDVAECKDYAGNKYSVMSMVDISTGFHVARVVKEGGTMPTSESCAKALMEGWTSWAGWPKMVTMDRGVHNRGNMQKILASHGCEVVYAPLETPSAIGKVERSQGVMKAMLRKVVADTESTGLTSFETCLYETLTTKNSMTRQSGYSAAQWVLGRNPRTPGSVTDLDEAGNLGVLESKFDSSAQFYLQHQARMAAQRAFVHLDTSSRVARALTRNAAVQSQEYSVGDLVCYRRDTQAGGTQWSTACRIIGHDPHQGVWLLHEGVPVLCSAAKLRSANEAEFGLQLNEQHPCFA